MVERSIRGSKTSENRFSRNHYNQPREKRPHTLAVQQLTVDIHIIAKGFFLFFYFLRARFALILMSLLFANTNAARDEFASTRIKNCVPIRKVDLS